MMASTHDYVKDIRNEDIKIYINGEYHHRSEAKISVFDSGFLLGDGVFFLGDFSFLGIHCKTLYVNRRNLVGP